MKLLIVDDEELIRLKLKHIASHPSLHFHSIETATNVFEALDSIKKEVPAVILSDIRMPQKSGLDLARYIHEQNLPSKIILITGFSDFEYAKAGIAYQVFDYILKPVDEDGTVSVIHKALHQYMEEQKHQELYQSFQNYYASHQEDIRRQIIQRLLFHPLSLEPKKFMNDMALLDFPFHHYELIGCRHQSRNNSRSLKAELFISYVLEDCFTSVLGKSSLLYSHGNILFCIVPLLQRQREYLDGLHDRLEQAMEDFARQYHQRIKLGISRTGSSLPELDQLREQVTICLNYPQMQSEVAVYYEDLPISFNKLLTVNSEISTMIHLLQDKNREAFLASASSFLCFINKYGENFQRQAINLLLCNLSLCFNGLDLDPALLHRLNSHITDCLQNLDILSHDTEKILSWLESLYDEFTRMGNQSGSILIEQIKSFICDNFHKPLGLTEIADHLRRNPSYISRFIKQQTGQNLTQILTEVRMSHAKTLLKNSNMKIADIAQKTGYPNQQYFNRIFTEQEGMSPSDFRKITQAFKNR